MQLSPKAALLVPPREKPKNPRGNWDCGKVGMVNGRSMFHRIGPTKRSGPPMEGGKAFSKVFRLERTYPFSFRPKFPDVFVEWIASIMFECFDISKALKFYFGFQRGEGAGNGGRRQRGTSNAINIPLNTGIHNFYRMKKYQGVDKVPFKLCIFGE